MGLLEYLDENRQYIPSLDVLDDFTHTANSIPSRSSVPSTEQQQRNQQAFEEMISPDSPQSQEALNTALQYGSIGGGIGKFVGNGIDNIASKVWGLTRKHPIYTAIGAVALANNPFSSIIDYFSSSNKNRNNDLATRIKDISNRNPELTMDALRQAKREVATDSNPSLPTQDPNHIGDEIFGMNYDVSRELSPNEKSYYKTIQSDYKANKKYQENYARLARTIDSLNQLGKTYTGKGSNQLNKQNYYNSNKVLQQFAHEIQTDKDYRNDVALTLKLLHDKKQLQNGSAFAVALSQLIRESNNSAGSAQKYKALLEFMAATTGDKGYQSQAASARKAAEAEALRIEKFNEKREAAAKADIDKAQRDLEAMGYRMGADRVLSDNIPHFNDLDEDAKDKLTRAYYTLMDDKYDNPQQYAKAINTIHATMNDAHLYKPWIGSGDKQKFSFGSGKWDHLFDANNNNENELTDHLLKHYVPAGFATSLPAPAKQKSGKKSNSR